MTTPEALSYLASAPTTVTVPRPVAEALRAEVERLSGPVRTLDLKPGDVVWLGEWTLDRYGGADRRFITRNADGDPVLRLARAFAEQLPRVYRSWCERWHSGEQRSWCEGWHSGEQPSLFHATEACDQFILATWGPK